MAADVDGVLETLRRKSWSRPAIASDNGIRSKIRRFDIGDIVRLTEFAKAEAGPAASIDLYRAWIDLQEGRSPHAFVAWFNLGTELSALKESSAAQLCFRNALALKPDFYQAAINLGLNLEANGNDAEALQVWTSTLQPVDARTQLLNQKGRLEEKLNQLDVAEETLFSSLLTNPRQPEVIQHWLLLRQKKCAWPTLGGGIPGIDLATLAAGAGPISCLALTDDVGEQTRIVGDWLSRRPERAAAHLAPSHGYRHDRIRIGYLSSDFCMHPISYLIAELIERHDRSAFEVYGYECSPEDGSAIRRRVLGAFDKVTTITDLSDDDAARRVRADEIDILVDLNGPTKGMRLGLLKAKPAPVLATYLGFVGPVPIPEIDHLLCDEFTVPPREAARYTPAPLYIPGCYQANDSRLPVAPPVSRADVGLPADKFVFCCFSNSYKVTEHIFEAWMKILALTPNSVLWVLEDNPFLKPNMLKRAAERGIDPARLIFAGRVAAEMYLSRMRCADLFLDTHPYNAGTTASDALRMGLPLVTLSGRAFASRMAGSLLTAVGLPELVTESVDAYVARAVALAVDTTEYRRIRNHLEGGAWNRTLGDAAGFTKRLEDVFRKIRKLPTDLTAGIRLTAAA